MLTATSGTGTVSFKSKNEKRICMQMFFHNNETKNMSLSFWRVRYFRQSNHFPLKATFIRSIDFFTFMESFKSA